MEPAQSVLSSRGLFQSVVRRSVWVPSSRLETREFATPAGSAGTRNAYDFMNSDLGIGQWGPTTALPCLQGANAQQQVLLRGRAILPKLLDT